MKTSHGAKLLPKYEDSYVKGPLPLSTATATDGEAVPCWACDYCAALGLHITLPASNPDHTTSGCEILRNLRVSISLSRGWLEPLRERRGTITDCQVIEDTALVFRVGALKRPFVYLIMTIKEVKIRRLVYVGSYVKITLYPDNRSDCLKDMYLVQEIEKAVRKYNKADYRFVGPEKSVLGDRRATVGEALADPILTGDERATAGEVLADPIPIGDGRAAVGEIATDSAPVSAAACGSTKDAAKVVPSLFRYVNGLKRGYNTEDRSIRQVRFKISRYGAVEETIRFEQPATEREAVEAVEGFLSEPLTEEYYAAIKDDLAHELDWDRACRWFPCRGACMELRLLKRVTLDDGCLTFRVDS
jgi:hypothetical protein